MRRTALSSASCLLVVCLLLTACETGEGNRASGEVAAGFEYDQDDVNAPWPFRPVDMRIHPLTHVSLDAQKNACTIEARLEMLDMTDDSTKCFGRVRLELFDAGSTSESALKQWNIDLRNLELNERHYDDVTRMYRFNLDIMLNEMPDRPGVRAYFLSTTGETMQARHMLAAMKDRP